jgi:hypothetical protein
MRPPFVVGHRLERSFLLHQPADERTDDLVRIAERNALRDQVVRDVGGEQQALMRPQPSRAG